jgi:SNF2 family DNA or RNA helicase
MHSPANTSVSEIELRDYQVIARDRLIDLLTHRFTAADMSDTGVGKTITAIATATALPMPFVVICPKNTKSHWRYVGKAMGAKDSCLGVYNWEQIKLGGVSTIYNHADGWCKNLSRKVLLIFDEAHRAKNHKTLNARILRRARDQGHFILLLSGTMFQSVLSLAGLGYPLGLVARQSFWFSFARQFGAGLSFWGGYEDQSNRSQQQSLHKLLARVGVRVTKQDIAAEANCLHQADLVDSEAAADLNQIYETLSEEIAALERADATASEVLVARLRGRQAAELIKAQVFVEFCVEHLEAGNKVILFFNFNRSIQWAEGFLESKAIASLTINGETPQKRRDFALIEFNFGPVDVLLLNIAAGGEGINLHDSTGNKPRVALISPPESASVLVQALGRIDRIGAKSVGLNRVLFVAGTREEDVFHSVRAKIGRLSMLNDGDLDLGFLHSSRD